MKISSLQFKSIPTHINTIAIYGHDESCIEYLKNTILKKYYITEGIENIYNPNLFNQNLCFIASINTNIEFNKILPNNLILIVEYTNIKPNQQKKLLQHNSNMLISCFGGSNLQNLINSHLNPNSNIDSKAIQYLSHTFSNHHGLLIQELKKLQHWTQPITVDTIIDHITIPFNAQYYQIANYYLSKQKLLFWQELYSMRNKNIDDIVIIRYITSFVLDLFNYKKLNKTPKSQIFFLYRNIFLNIIQKNTLLTLKNTLIKLIETEANLQNSCGLLEDILLDF